MHFRHILLAFACVPYVAPAHAQSTATLNRQIEALQEQVRALNQQLQNLQSQVMQAQRDQAATDETVTQMKATSAPAPSGIVASMPSNRPTLATADGRNSISLVGRVHWDVGDYLHYHAQDTRSPAAVSPTPATLNSGQNVRRARLGVQGKIFGDWNYALIYDFGGSQDSGAGGINASGIETAEIGYTGFRPLTVEGGIQDVPWTLDESISSNDTMFIERSSPQVIATNLVAGDSRSNLGGHWNDNRAWVGAYLTGPLSGTSHSAPQQIGAVERATFQVIQSEQYNFHIGADFAQLIKPPTSDGARVVTTFSDRPELRIDPSRIINTGTLGSLTNPVKGAQIYDFETAAGVGPLFGQAEYFHYDVWRQGLSTASFNGGYLQASYTLTGESRKYLPSTGAYTGLSPAHPFDFTHFGEGAWGALELGARYSIIDLSSNYVAGAPLSRSTNAVSGGEQQVVAIGTNWYVNSNIRFMLDYLHGWIGKHNGGTLAATGIPIGVGTGANFDAIALRSQIAW